MSELSLILTCMLDTLYQKYNYLLRSLDLWWLEPVFLAEYAAAVQNKGSPLRGCVGFIDGNFCNSLKKK